MPTEGLLGFGATKYGSPLETHQGQVSIDKLLVSILLERAVNNHFHFSLTVSHASNLLLTRELVKLALQHRLPPLV